MMTKEQYLEIVEDYDLRSEKADKNGILHVLTLDAIEVRADLEAEGARMGDHLGD